MQFRPLAGEHRPMKLGLLMTRDEDRTQLHKTFIRHAEQWIEAQRSRLFSGHDPQATK